MANMKNFQNEEMKVPMMVPAGEGRSLTPEEVAEILRADERREKMVHDELMSYREKGEWEKFVDLSLMYRNDLLAEAFEYYDEVPDELKYDWIMDAYCHTGDSIPDVWLAVCEARMYGKPVLPDEWKDKETVTVYRAGTEDEADAPYNLSWTTDKRVAFWFYRRPSIWGPKHVWQAEIRPKDIIGYLTQRNESEVLQFDAVRTLTDITDEAVSEQGQQLADDYSNEVRESLRRCGLNCG